MNSILEKYKFDCIWHFTDFSNLDLIMEYNGLLSLCEIELRGIKVPKPGGNTWRHDADKIKGIHEYIHLAFIDDHPMLYITKQDGRILNPIWLKISSSILLKEDVRFCSDVSNKSSVAILDADEAKTQIDFEVLFTYMDWRDKEVKARREAAKKSEILIPNFISIEHILDFKNG